MVICTECGRENQPDSRYCSNCGEPLETESIQVQEETLNHENKPEKNYWPMVLPIAVLAIMIGIVLYNYNHTKAVNEHVDDQKERAEELALEGKYKQAEEQLEEAKKKRPNYNAIQQNLDSLHKVMNLDKRLDGVSDAVENNELEKAQKELTSVSSQMRKDENRLMVTLTPKFNTMDSRITVSKINNEVKEMTSVEDLAEKLNTLSGLDLEEATRAREKIMDKIVSICTKKAEEAMKEKQFNEAIATVDQGLQYAVNHDKLAQLKERIRQEKQAFEQEKRDRIERAMEQAAEEALKNQEEAVKVDKVEAKKDEFGDLKVFGEVKSEATKIVSSIEITYDLIGKDDKVLATETAQVYPMYLNPGDTGKFEKMHYEIEEESVSVKVTNVQWYVE
ncbi:zinc ribbon domain-containing protein [Halobacillus sp. Marseille-Q1614]|uniref:zinc ribbon domain-containing protein n=1 Tax=Halobacillus sp. Marseille-Q1614 TaxID=2709134 RepID=UPI00156FEF13|nr:zinc ribbon domain-containing protein [Halobacillus sp. Marseille-Q1614]